MSEPHCNKLVDILQPDIQSNMTQSLNSISRNNLIMPSMITYFDLRFMGTELVKLLCDIFGMSDKSCAHAIYDFVYHVDRYAHNDISTDLLLTSFGEKIKLAAQWHIYSGASGCMYIYIATTYRWLIV